MKWCSTICWLELKSFFASRPKLFIDRVLFVHYTYVCKNLHHQLGIAMYAYLFFHNKMINTPLKKKINIMHYQWKRKQTQLVWHDRAYILTWHRIYNIRFTNMEHKHAKVRVILFFTVLSIHQEHAICTYHLPSYPPMT
jgi:hypothetical protein